MSHYDSRILGRTFGGYYAGSNENEWDVRVVCGGAGCGTIEKLEKRSDIGICFAVLCEKRYIELSL